MLFPILIYLGASALERRPAVGAWLGDMSYAAYAIHHPLLGLLKTFGGGAVALQGVPHQVVFVGVVSLLAAGVAALEARVTKLRSRRPHLADDRNPAGRAV